MKKFIIKVGIFFIIAILIDFLFGKLFEMLIDKAKGGDTYRNNYICNKVEEHILVFGSSRAIHHYNPVIIKDSLNMTCYNCGQEGNGIILNYGRFLLINQRYHPNYIIYDITPVFDLLQGKDNQKYLGWLRAYYNRNGIPDIFNSVDPSETWKMHSQLYRFNSKFIQIVSDAIHPIQDSGILGFRPLKGEMDTMKISKQSVEKQIYEYDTLKIQYFEKMINTSQKTKFIFTLSPNYNEIDTTVLYPIKTLCSKYNIPMINLSNDPKYLHNSIYFKDGSHLNSRGADEFTKDIVKKIKETIITSSKNHP